MYNSDWNKCNEKEEIKKEHKDENTCVSINVFCEDCKKENDYKEDSYNKCDCKKEPEQEPKKDNTCVSINIFCNDKKDSKHDGWKDDCKKEKERKEDNTCVQVNIFCDDCKK